MVARMGHWDDFIENDDVWACLSAVILLAIGKQVNPEGYTNWSTAFAGTLGNPDIVSYLKASNALTIGSMILVNSFLSSS